MAIAIRPQITDRRPQTADLKLETTGVSLSSPNEVVGDINQRSSITPLEDDNHFWLSSPRADRLSSPRADRLSSPRVFGGDPIQIQGEGEITNYSCNPQTKLCSPISSSGSATLFSATAAAAGAALIVAQTKGTGDEDDVAIRQFQNVARDITELEEPAARIYRAALKELELASQGPYAGSAGIEGFFEGQFRRISALERIMTHTLAKLGKSYDDLPRYNEVHKDFRRMLGRLEASVTEIYNEYASHRTDAEALAYEILKGGTSADVSGEAGRDVILQSVSWNRRMSAQVAALSAALRAKIMMLDAQLNTSAGRPNVALKIYDRIGNSMTAGVSELTVQGKKTSVLKLLAMQADIAIYKADTLFRAGEVSDGMSGLRTAVDAFGDVLQFAAEEGMYEYVTTAVSAYNNVIVRCLESLAQYKNDMFISKHYENLASALKMRAEAFEAEATKAISSLDVERDGVFKQLAANTYERLAQILVRQARVLMIRTYQAQRQKNMPEAIILNRKQEADEVFLRAEQAMSDANNVFDVLKVESHVTRTDNLRRAIAYEMSAAGRLFTARQNQGNAALYNDLLLDLTEAVKLYSEGNDKGSLNAVGRELAVAFSELGDIHTKEGKFALASDNYEKAYFSIIRAEDLKGSIQYAQKLFDSAMSLAGEYRTNPDFQKAMDNYLIAYRIAGQAVDSVENIWRDNERLKLDEQVKHRFMRAGVAESIARLLNEQQDPDLRNKGAEWFKTARDLYAEVTILCNKIYGMRDLVTLKAAAHTKALTAEGSLPSYESEDAEKIWFRDHELEKRVSVLRMSEDKWAAMNDLLDHMGKVLHESRDNLRTELSEKGMESRVAKRMEASGIKPEEFRIVIDLIHERPRKLRRRDKTGTEKIEGRVK